MSSHRRRCSGGSMARHWRTMSRMRPATRLRCGAPAVAGVKGRMQRSSGSTFRRAAGCNTARRRLCQHHAFRERSVDEGTGGAIAAGRSRSRRSRGRARARGAGPRHPSLWLELVRRNPRASATASTSPRSATTARSAARCGSPTGPSPAPSCCATSTRSPFATASSTSSLSSGARCISAPAAHFAPARRASAERRHAQRHPFGQPDPAVGGRPLARAAASVLLRRDDLQRRRLLARPRPGGRLRWRGVSPAGRALWRGR